MAKAPTSEVLKLGTASSPARLSFADKLYKAKSFSPDQEAKYQSSFLLDPTNKEHAAQIAAVKKAAIDLIQGEKLDPKDFKLCFGKGDDKKYDGYAGMIYFVASNSVRPTVVNRRNNPVVEGDPQAPYSGCYVIGSITLWLQNNKWGKRINANLRAVQFVKDGQAFGAQAVNADEEFEPLETDDGGAAGPDPFDL